MYRVDENPMRVEHGYSALYGYGHDFFQPAFFLWLSLKLQNEHSVFHFICNLRLLPKKNPLPV
jgi:hypothetical protein